MSKMRLFKHVLKDGDEFLFSAIIHNQNIAGDTSWLQSVRRSLVWLQDQIGDLELPNCLWDLSALGDWEIARPYHRQLHKQIKEGIRAHMWRVRVLCEMKQANRDQEILLREAGWSFTPAEEVTVEDTDTVTCSTCGKAFATHAALATHEQRLHGMRIACRRFARDPTCRACNRFYHTRVRLLHHWHHGKTGCWVCIMRDFDPMTVEETVFLDERDRKDGHAFHQHGLRSKEQDLMWRMATQSEIDAVFRPRHTIGHDDPTELELNTWKEYGLLPVGQGGRQATKRIWQGLELVNVQEEVQEFERELQKQVSRWTLDFDWVPRPLALGTRYLLILFSGHRRPGDMGCWAQWTSDIVPICIDLAIHPVEGNIMRDGAWMHLIRRRKVVGGHGGPPCETFSEARWINDGDRASGPRPLRNAEYPWGLLCRSLREVKQGAIGTILFCRTVFILMMIHLFGGATTLEHPRGPRQTPEQGGQRWAIWFSAFLRRWGLGPQIQQITFLQGPYGQKFSKPTTIQAGRLPHLPHALYSGYNKSWRMTEVLGGRDPTTRTWRTAKAKTYQERLCQVLVEQFVWFSRQTLAEGEEEDPADLNAMLEALGHQWDPYLHEQTGNQMKGGYHPQAYGDAGA